MSISISSENSKLEKTARLLWTRRDQL